MDDEEYERRAREYYDKKTAHREEMLVPLAWMAVIFFLILVLKGVWDMLKWVMTYAL
jgi:hypothetical protein